MADLALMVAAKTTERTAFREGDVLVAFTRRAIWQCHAHRLCHHRLAPRNRDGWRTDGLARRYLEQVCVRRFERISAREVRCVNLVTGESEVFSDVPNAGGFAIDVERYLALRQGHSGCRVFGRAGREVWYGSEERAPAEKCERVWQMIEGETAHRKDPDPRWHFTPVEKRTYLCCHLDAYDDDEDEVNRMQNHEMLWDTDYEPHAEREDSGDLGQMRRAFIDWTQIPGVKVQHVTNPEREVDLRDTPAPAALVNYRARINMWDHRRG